MADLLAISGMNPWVAKGNRGGWWTLLDYESLVGSCVLLIICENLTISLSLSRSLSPSLPITGAIVGLDQSSYEVNEGDGSFTVCVILYDGVPSSDTDIQLNIRRRRGGTAGIYSIYSYGLANLLCTCPSLSSYKN